ncbi:hypothetical protein CFB46_23330 [Burkholderia sp. HI2761]|uniref:hypothetical protein n=1 Tax=unclassified Burkholderia TaxID=2613784 RepID=UPI000B79CE98|nr:MULTISPECIES: hypothetical protein [unclassified Burkholderia]MPV61407.1 hypothetical protein [Burkholderia sp. BE24]OXJ25002.1 hypothetical protein CFB46_23330 [Burkholderia sp. HI2761]
MGKRKAFVKSDLATIEVEHAAGDDGYISIPADVIPPADTVVRLGINASKRRQFDFGPWYTVGIDPITYACQRQIERFLDKQDLDVEISTVAGYCTGVRHFLDYLLIHAAAIGRALQLHDINRDVLDSYLAFLRDRGVSTLTQRVCYAYTKSVLVALGRRGLFELMISGDNATFPSNPFPGSHRHDRGETPLTRAERKAFTAAVKTAVIPIMTIDTPPTSTLLAYALLVVALHTGRNTTALMEMPIDCLRPHPKDGLEFLVLYKRRGHTTTKVVIRSETTAERSVESNPALRPAVSRLIRRVIELTDQIRMEAPPDIRNRVWLYPTRQIDGQRQIVNLKIGVLDEAIKKLVHGNNLVDNDSKPLRINISRLRKTFTNRVNEILEGDIVTTAVTAGNTAPVTSRHYLRPGEDAKQDWRFMGICLVDELLSGTLGATERTPLGKCSDIKMGEYAPKRADATCERFLNCLRCRNYVVTGDDLWRLYSFYWRVLRERSRMDQHRWDRQFKHIPRLIERDVIAAGIARKIFRKGDVTAARERARHDPHPFWASQTILDDLESLQ